MHHQPCSSEKCEIVNTLADIYPEYPVYGYRRLTACLQRQGYKINGKRVLRLLREMVLKAIYPGPKTTTVDKAAPKYPYTLAGMALTKPHQT